MRSSKDSIFEGKAPKWRIDEAKRTTKQVVAHAVDLIWINESNAVTLYSDVLTKQIPRSYAAHAFNVFRKAMYQIEIVRLCALWDKANLERETIPTVIELIDHPAVLSQLSETVRAQYSGTVAADDAVATDSDAEVLKFYHAKEGKEWSQRAVAELRDAVRRARSIQKSGRLKAMRTLRDIRIAHNLTGDAMKKVGIVEPIKDQDERLVLEETLSIITVLYRWVNGVGISFEASQKIDRKCVEALWTNCAFSIKQEPSRRGARP